MTALPPDIIRRPDHPAGVQVFDIADERFGPPRRVFLHVPPGPAPDAGWPLLCMTDGNAMIATAVDAMRIQASYPAGTGVAPGVIVAVGYPTEDAYDPVRRSWDLGPPPGRTYPPFWEGTPPVRTGGGADLAAFLTEVVLPFAAERAPLDPARRSLFGHSLGGLFTLWLMFTQPGRFTTWIAASPAITWEDSFLLDAEAGYAPDGPARIFLSAGEYEDAILAPFEAARADASERLAHKTAIRTVAAAREMAGRLARRPGLSVSCEIHAGENHMSVLPVAVGRAVRQAFPLG